MRLSTVQMDAMEKATEAGCLIRWPGGFWTTEEKTGGTAFGPPKWYVGTQTVEALVTKRLLKKVNHEMVVPVDQKPKRSITMADIPRYTSEGNYTVNMMIGHFMHWLDEEIEEHGLQLNPDFQRGHVWTDEQQSRYIEHLLKGGKTGKTLYFNQPGWGHTFHGEYVCVDGLQRITAIKKFLSNIVPAFGYYFDQFDDKEILCRRIDIIVNINNLKTRSEVLQWYIEFNSGGTVHTEEEIERVKKLLEKEKEANQ